MHKIKKILIVGFGAIGQKHLKNLRKILPKSDFAILTSQKIKKKKIKIFNLLKDAKKFRPSLVLICNQATEHINYAKIFLNMRCHLFIEKPVATNVNQLTKFIKEIKNKKITILSGYNLRFEPSLIFFKKIVDSKLLGTILSVRSEVGQYLPSWRDKDYSKSVSAHIKTGGGVINELSHDIDILLLLFKKIQIISALNYKVSNLRINTEDTAHVIFKSNKRKSIFFINLLMDFYRHDHTRKCTVIGSKTTAVWNGLERKITIFKKNNIISKVYKFSKNKQISYYNEMKYLVKSIQNRKNLIKDFKSNVQLLKILNEIRRNKCSV
jgi:predicted dehydrogenase